MAAATQLPERVLDVVVPDELIADGPIEALVPGAGRDDVRMLVAHRGDGRLVHAHARDLADHLQAGDVLLVNTSRTLPAAVPTADGALVVHLSTQLGSHRWVVELREPDRRGSAPHPVGDPLALDLPGDAHLRLVAPYGSTGAVVRRGTDHRPHRLWVAEIETPVPVGEWLRWVGRPIRYGSTATTWPIADYQTLFAAPTPAPIGLGSAEMPSAARPITAAVLSRVIAAGVVVAPITLHCGVSSLEAHELPYPERYQVPGTTARLVDAAPAAGGRVIAVGTTATRAIETDADEDGHAHPGDGWTDLVITPERGLRVVDGIISGWHEPEASHLLLMEAVAGRELLEHSYDAALEARYRWHEFGDVHLVLP
jgi:S-adenosylmethionine:tRNA ribosyltransferase-isomerase